MKLAVHSKRKIDNTYETWHALSAVTEPQHGTRIPYTGSLEANIICQSSSTKSRKTRSTGDAASGADNGLSGRMPPSPWKNGTNISTRN